MMGGNTGQDRATDAGDGPADKKKSRTTKAMPVQDFLAGGSGPQLPRNKQVCGRLGRGHPFSMCGPV